MSRSSQKHRLSFSTSTLFCVVLLVAKVVLIVLFNKGAVSLPNVRSDLEDPDYPRTWFQHTAPPVQIQLGNTIHYGLNGSEADMEWDSLTPYDGIIHLGEEDDRQPYSIAMFHQLRCLNIIRKSLAERRASKGTSEIPYLTHHCMNYLRQTTLCDADIHLEPCLGTKANVYPDVRACRDWRVVYEELERNHES